MTKFRLTDQFIHKYKDVRPPFGFNGLGELVYLRTYSRLKHDGENEQWFETVQRVVEGTFNMQKNWIEQHSLGWNLRKAQISAQEMYDRIFNMKFLPPGRGLWAMGSSITEERGLFAALNNCAFVSTGNIKEDLASSFCFLMDASMLGVGCGFDTKGSGQITIKQPKKESILISISDDREGWIESVRKLLESYFLGELCVSFDYSLIRQEGTLIKGFGGVSSGYKPLEDCHKSLKDVLDKNISKPISTTTIVDIMNIIGKCVVSGNVRRTAEIVFGDYNSPEYLDLKNYKVNPARENYGWTSNNSIFADLGMNYHQTCERVKINGEPGFSWLDNMKGYSRMNNGPDNKDHRVSGGNPCLPAWAKVLTPNGIRDLSEINVGDQIWSETGWTKVLKKWSTGINTVWKFTTSTGSLYSTENHRIVNNGQKIEVGLSESIDCLRGVYDYQFKIDSQDVMDGLVLGDGGLRRRDKENKPTVLYIGKDDRDYFKSEVSHLIKETSCVKKECLCCYVESTLSEYELTDRHLRNIPSRYLINKIRLSGLLKGLFSANGTIGYGGIGFKTTSKLLMERVQLALSSLGIKSSCSAEAGYKRQFKPGQKEYDCKASYNVKINTDALRFQQIIGFIQIYKQNKLSTYIKNKSRTFDKKPSFAIKDKTVFSQEEVFDITVDNESHTFWCNGFNISNCLEQSLESYELCCLVETFPANHKTLEDYLITLKYAYLYAKTVTLGKTHWAETNRVMLRNRRIGCSMSGIVQFITKNGLHSLKQWCEEGYKAIEYYDTVYSDWLAIPKSIKKTSVKPSGSVSLVAGATPGIHFPESRFYIRRMRLSKFSDLVKPLEKAGYNIEPCVGSEETTVVVEIPVDVGEGVRTIDQVSMWEQLSLAAFLQKHWADNQVSCTVTFQEHEANQIEHALNYFQYQLKGISFLPKLKKGAAYKQMPYEEITEERYKEIAKQLKPIKFKSINNEQADIEKFCSSDACVLK